MRLSTKALLFGACILATTTALISAPVQGSVHDEVVSANPANFTPDVNEGKVSSIAQIGDTTIAGGKFTTVTPEDGTTPINRKNIFAFDATDGTISDTFVPVLDGVVNRVVSTGDGQTAYIAGEFKTVDGIKRSKVARINVTTGALDPTFVPPAINGKINDMVLSDGALYVAGGFTKVGPVFKSGVAVLNPVTGKDTGGITSSFTGTFNGGSVAVKAIDVSDDGNRLVAIGNFRAVDGQSRVQIAVLNTSVSPATVSNWSTTRFSTACSRSFDTYMRDVSIHPSGNWFVVVTTGAFSGGAGSGTMCDAASRWEFGAQVSGTQPTWVNYTGGDTLTAVTAMDKLVYVGGHQRWMNNPFNSDSKGPGAVDRPGLTVLDPRNGMPFSWNPTRARGVGLWEFTPVDKGVWIAHDSNRLGKEDRRRLGFMPLNGGTALPPENTGSLPGDVFAFGTSTSDDGVRRAMQQSSVTSSASAAVGGIDWSSSRGSFMVDGLLYTAFSNGTLRTRTFDGTTFGAESTVNLNGLSAFASDLANMTSMFYDRTSGRLYYTISSSNRLFYRYFLPESKIGGAIRFDAGGPSGGIDWSRAGGMFVAGGQLYFADRFDGTLSTINWTGTFVSGTRSQISGPGIDGHDWRFRSVFLRAS
jgi:hypothetical protein